MTAKEAEGTQNLTPPAPAEEPVLKPPLTPFPRKPLLRLQVNEF